MMYYTLLRYLGAAVLLPGAALSAAHAQITMATNVPGIRAVAPPPAGFDPVTASPAARKQYAIPPAPDPTAAPGAYNQWQKAMGGLRNRPAAPMLTQTNIYNGPIKNKKVSPSVPPGNTVVGPSLGKIAGAPSNNIVGETASNWSGPSIVATSGNPFALEAIQGEFVVPTARQAFGTCTGGWDYSALWPGIDGNGSNDVLQAGVEADAYCSGGATQAFYSAWIEWYPNPETQVPSPVINPGDLVFIQVWNVSPTVGYAYFYDYSTQETNEYQLTAPGGTTLQGNSVEWIVERPGVGCCLAHLTNYIDVSWPYNVAWNYAAATPTYYYPGADPAPYTLELITMLGNQSGTGSAISHGSPQNFGFLYFEDTAGALGAGAVAPYQ
jgi:Peptidase A4 family